ncbi:MAG: fibronectin type III domain-containing protein [Gammaproteobacteria bacterium]|nr:fibronectin type III domain-containing protein [Gammaproteobacteria bacterium]
MTGVVYDNLLPFSMDFSLDRNEFFGGSNVQPADPLFVPAGLFLAISDNAEEPFYKVSSSGSRVLLNNSRLRFGNSAWYAGKATATATNSTTVPDGDLDLSTQYTITMQITDLQLADGPLEIRVDNNTTSSANSIFGTDSLILSLTPNEGLTLGELVINVPGAVTMGGTEIVSKHIDNHIGTPNSLLGFRCPSACVDTTLPSDQQVLPTGGGIEISSIVIDHPVGATLQLPLEPAVPVLVADDTAIDVSWNPVGNATAYNVAYNSAEDNPATATVVAGDITGTSTTITGLANGTLYYVYVSAKNAAGNGPYSNSLDDTVPAANPSVTPIGDPPTTPTGLVVTAGVEAITVVWDEESLATTYEIAYNVGTDSTSGATEVVDLSGTALIITDLEAAAAASTPVYVFVRARNGSGVSDYSASATATPTSPVAGSWTGAALEIFGTDGSAASGSLDKNNVTQVTITSTGGALSSDTRRHYFAYQSVTANDFTITARVKSVTANGGAVAEGNVSRFGMMLTNNITTGVTTFAETGSFGEIGFYYNGTPALVGSRAQMKETDVVTRSDIGGLAVGDWIRLQILDDTTNKRIRQSTSTDGVTFTQANSTTDFQADAGDNSWFWGFYAAPGANNVTIEFDNISITTP